MNERLGRNIPTLLAASVLFALAGMANAQDAESDQATPAQDVGSQGEKPAKATDLSAVVVTGTRISNRTHAESLVPIDVIPAEVLTQSGAIDLGSALDQVVPSLNFPLASMSDTFAFTRPFQMRGLNSDQVLILVDGKRWHSSALMLTLGQVRSEEHTSELQSLMRISSAVLSLKKKT